MDQHRLEIIIDRVLRSAILGYIFIMSIPHTTALRSILLVLAIVSLAGLAVIRRVNPLRKTPLDIPIAFLFTVQIFKSLHSLDPHYSLDVFWEEVVRQLAVFYLIVSSYRTSRHVQRIHMVLLISLGVVSVVGLAGYIHGNMIKDSRAVSYFGNYGRAAFYTAMLFQVALGHFLCSRKLLRGAVLMMLMITSVGFMLVTFSRGAWLSTLIGIFIITTLKDRRMLFVLLVVAIIIPWFLPPDIIDRAVSITEINGIRDGTSIGDRIWLWRSAADMIRERPWLGAGFGNRIFQHLYPQYMYSQSSGIIFENSHNLYLQILVETGILGLIGFLLLLGTILFQAIRRLIRCSDPQIQGQLLGLIGSIIVFSVFSITTFRYENEIGLLFWVITACLMILARQPSAAD